MFYIARQMVSKHANIIPFDHRQRTITVYNKELIPMEILAPLNMHNADFAPYNGEC